eukprot:m.70506 g.70506  ORF g.70506 m.70506 type:complete len:74 (+) comp12261_c1_seq1:171-392(+)
MSHSMLYADAFVGSLSCLVGGCGIVSRPAAVQTTTSYPFKKQLSFFFFFYFFRSSWMPHLSVYMYLAHHLLAA